MGDTNIMIDSSTLYQLNESISNKIMYDYFIDDTKKLMLEVAVNQNADGSFGEMR